MKEQQSNSEQLKTIAVALVFVLCLVTCFSLVLQHITGVPHPFLASWSSAVVESESMEPTIAVGSFVVLERSDRYAPGDVITYMHRDGYTVTHRIIAIDDTNVITQGDANDYADSEIQMEQIIGKVIYSIPHLGTVLVTLQKPEMIIMIVAIVVLLFQLLEAIRKPLPFREEEN